jgi:uncharacterized membrane protein
LGVYFVLVSAVTLVIGFVQLPLGQWPIFAIILGIALAVLGVTGLVTAVTGKGSISRSRRTRESQRKLALVGLGFFSLAIVLSIVSDLGTWSVTDTMTFGIWIAIAGMFVAQVVVVNRAISQSGT